MLKNIIILIFVLLISSVCLGEKVALLVNGGYGPYANHSGFSQQMQRWYPALRGAGYAVENIWVMDSDGRDNDYPIWPEYGYLTYSSPAFEHSREYDGTAFFENFMGSFFKSWVDTPKGFYGNSVVYDSTVESWDTITDQMALAGNADDELLVVLIDHGGASEDGTYTFGAWDYEEVSPGDFKGVRDLIGGVEMSGYLDRIPYDRRAIVVATCHAAAAWQHFENDNTILLANCGADEYGWIGCPVEYQTLSLPFWLKSGYGWGYELTAGIGLGDLNDDGRISWAEISQYGYDNDPYGPVTGPFWVGGSYGWVTEHPQLFDPGELAADWIVVQYIPGDANKDGSIDSQDFGILKDTFGGEGSWSAGDFNGDGVIDLQDFGLLKDNFGTGSVMIIPEPSTVILLTIGFMISGFYRKSKKWIK